MAVFEHILVPTDFGEPAEYALEIAIEIAKKFGSKITLLHVTWFPPLAYVSYGEGFAWPVDEVAKAGKKGIDDQIRVATALYPNIRGEVVTGDPWRAILEAAKTHGADLLVTGTHGRTGLSRAFLGSVAEKLVRASPIPVLTVSGKASAAAEAARR